MTETKCDSLNSQNIKLSNWSSYKRISSTLCNSMSIAYSSLMIFLESFFLLSILMIYKLKQFKL